MRPALASSLPLDSEEDGWYDRDDRQLIWGLDPMWRAWTYVGRDYQVPPGEQPLLPGLLHVCSTPPVSRRATTKSVPLRECAVTS